MELIPEEVIVSDYNGWTNYSTWRINLEYGLSDGDYNGYTEDMLQEMVEEHLEFNCENETTLSYALAFIDDVNWYEIEENIKADLDVS